MAQRPRRQRLGRFAFMVWKVRLGARDLTDLDLAFPSRPMLLMKLREGHSAFDGFFLDGNSRIAKPPTISLASVNGPAMT